MKTVRFGQYDSYEDFALILTSSNIDAPKIKTNMVDVSGADGSVDFSEAFGDVFYETRKLQFDFTYTGDSNSYAEKFSNIQNRLHGQKLNIVISDDPNFYYVGRIELDKWKSSKAIRKITISCECEPYKYQSVKRTYQITSNPQTIRFDNLRKRVKPTLVCTSSVSVTCNGKSVTLTANVPNTGTIRFVNGENSLVVAGGTGTLTITCIRGSL